MTWKEHPDNHNYEVLEHAEMDVLVRINRLPKGYLWQAGKFYGYCDTVEAAQDEAFEIYLIQSYASDAIS